MSGLRILITNNALAKRAGSELYVRDLALELLRRGHRPVVYSTRLGAVAAELRAATVPVISRPEQLGTPPDVIHGHHHVDAMIAMLHFTRTPAVYLCHGWLPWEEWPPRFSRIYRYLAVDETCRDRLVCEHGLAEHEVEVLLNFVDLARFRPRCPLPARPRRALVFSNEARASHGLQAIRQACTQFNVQLEVRGFGTGQVAQQPEELLGQFDVVFARARSALEALAVGNAVILFGPSGAGPLVTSSTFDRLRPLNFGIRALQQPCTAEYFVTQLQQYNAHDAAAVSQRVRAEAGLVSVVDRLVNIYHEVIAEHAECAAGDADQAQREASAYLQRLAPRPIDQHHGSVRRLLGRASVLLRENMVLSAGEWRSWLGRILSRPQFLRRPSTQTNQHATSPRS